MKEVVIGNVYNEKLGDHFNVTAWISGTEDNKDEAPQLYLTYPVFIEIDGDLEVKYTSTAIWIDKPEELINMLEILKERLKNTGDNNK